MRRNLEARFGSDAGWNGLSHAGGAQKYEKKKLATVVGGEIQKMFSDGS